jgi:ubiquinone/menaquinone biosynthesis C-methylase UbiE
MTHWTERLYKEQAGLFASLLENKFEQATDEVQELLCLVEQERNERPERVLDVACGIGRHIIAFAEEDCHAHGLDISEEFIEQAKARAIEEELEDKTEFQVEDMRRLDEWEGSYDLITNFWNSLGYYDKETDIDILENMGQLLSEDGTLAIEMGNKEFYVKNYDSSSVHETGEQLHVNRKNFDLVTGRFQTTVDVFSTKNNEYEHLNTMEFQPRVYAPVELKEMCERAGFENIDLYGGFTGSELTLDSPRVVVLAS